jgi:hypothetical protein
MGRNVLKLSEQTSKKESFVKQTRKNEKISMTSLWSFRRDFLEKVINKKELT